MNQNKIKVVWICHFTTNELQSLLPLSTRINEFASWISNTLKGFENREDIEIHVVSPHINLTRSTDLNIRNICYHFIPYGFHLPDFLHRLDLFEFNLHTNFFFFRSKVRKTINRINPHIIELIGVENAYYSSSILDFRKKYPILITIQGFISQMKHNLVNQSPLLKKRIDIEEKILKSFKYYSGEQDSSTYISGYNTNFIFFKRYFPVNEELELNTIDTGKKFDCIYFGRLVKYKGAEDFIKVIAEMKKNKPNINACVIGEGDVNPLKALASELNCSANIAFDGFINTQEELFRYVKSSKVFLAPPYFERLSSTIREAMFLKVPIVAYATGGIPYLNEFDENIQLVETGDYEEMARKTIILLENETLRSNLAEKAFKYAHNEFGLARNVERVISAYRTIISEYKN